MSKKNHTITVSLTYPIEWATDQGKSEVKEVEFRRPKGKDIKGLGKDVTFEDLMRIASKISEFSPRFFDELDAVDCMKISEVIGDFLDSGQETGRTN